MSENNNQDKITSELKDLFLSDDSFRNIALSFLKPFYGGYEDLAIADLELGEVWTYLKLAQVLALVDGYYGSTNITRIYAQSSIQKINDILGQNGINQESLVPQYETFLKDQS